MGNAESSGRDNYCNFMAVPPVKNANMKKKKGKKAKATVEARYEEDEEELEEEHEEEEEEEEGQEGRVKFPAKKSQRKTTPKSTDPIPSRKAVNRHHPPHHTETSDEPTPRKKVTVVKKVKKAVTAPKYRGEGQGEEDDGDTMGDTLGGGEGYRGDTQDEISMVDNQLALAESRSQEVKKRTEALQRSMRGQEGQDKGQLPKLYQRQLEELAQDQHLAQLELQKAEDEKRQYQLLKEELLREQEQLARERQQLQDSFMEQQNKHDELQQHLAMIRHNVYPHPGEEHHGQGEADHDGIPIGMDAHEYSRYFGNHHEFNETKEGEVPPGSVTLTARNLNLLVPGDDNERGGENDGEDPQEEECPRCILLEKPVRNLCTGAACEQCWNEGSTDYHAVVYHMNNEHHMCTTLDYPESELKMLARQHKEYVDEWKAEWRHAHAVIAEDNAESKEHHHRGPGGDHSLCKPKFLFGCTAEEKRDQKIMQKHSEGDHSMCPPEHPRWALHDSEFIELNPKEKKLYRVLWRHAHDRHDICDYAPDYCECTQTQRKADIARYPGKQNIDNLDD